MRPLGHVPDGATVALPLGPSVAGWPFTVSFAATFVIGVEGVPKTPVPLSGVGWILVVTFTVVVAVLFPGVGSGVLLPAVVVSVTTPVLVGVNVVVQVIAAPTSRLVTGVAGVQLVVAPLGAPLTAHVAAVAVFGPLLTQLVEMLTGVPIITVCVLAPSACMSAEAALVIVQVMTSAASVTVTFEGLFGS